jgi:hypothetical protein
VVTPSGYFHPSCVKQLAEGDTLDTKTSVIRHADGRLEDIPACEYPHYTARGEVIDESAGEFDPPAIAHSWIEGASVVSSTSYGELNATWIVPPAPDSSDGQTVYFFPGFEQDPSPSVFSILQPVLGWWSGNWSIASWNCCIKGTTYSSTQIVVKPGDTIHGAMKNTCASGTLSCSTWNITTTDKTSGKSTTLSNSASDGQTFNWALAAVLEVYDIAQCSDYPSNGGLKITDIQLYDDNFSLVSSPAWTSDNFDRSAIPQCNYNVAIDPTQVELEYSTATLSVTPAVTVAFGSVKVGSSDTEKFTVENTGNGTLVGSVTVPSPFSIVSGGTYSLAAGAKQTVTIRFSPTSDQSYKRTLTFTGDAGTTRTVTGTGTGSGGSVLPDLAVLSASIPTSLQVAGTGQFSATVKNIGNEKAGKFRLGFFLSKTDSITASSILVGYCTYSSGLAPGASGSCAERLPIPSGLEPGTYYGGAIADYLGQVTETNRSSNTLLASNALSVKSSLPYLAVLSVSIPTSLPVGGTGQFSATIENLGDTNAGTFSLGFFLSTTDSISSSSILLGACTYNSGLAAGASTGCAGPLPLPSNLAPGTYYGGAIADYLDQVTGSSRSNSTLLASHTLTIE